MFNNIRYKNISSSLRFLFGLQKQNTIDLEMAARFRKNNLSKDYAECTSNLNRKNLGTYE